MRRGENQKDVFKGLKEREECERVSIGSNGGC
jgi:hypothetical protein